MLSSPMSKDMSEFWWLVDDPCGVGRCSWTDEALTGKEALGADRSASETWGTEVYSSPTEDSSGSAGQIYVCLLCPTERCSWQGRR